jgi:glutamate synthase (NADPH/NADH) large chain
VIALSLYLSPYPSSFETTSSLYVPDFEHDACGVGFVVHTKGVKSHSVIQKGLQILENLDHRGAVGADALMGDGAGILIQIPDSIFRSDLLSLGISLPPLGEFGVGMIFLPKEQASRLACKQELERVVRREGLTVLGWRQVPLNRSFPMSDRVKSTEPVIEQIFIGRGQSVITTDALERQLYIIRKTASHAIQALQLEHGKEYFVASMSARTVVYKGLLLANQVGVYYKDLSDPRAVSALALVHQRFSTNTFPAWELAHPYRMVAHNGEINTVKGNVNWINARTGAIQSPILGESLQKLWPLIYPGQSDTASFDNCLELLVMGGYPLAHAVMMMVPEAWEKHSGMTESRRSFYEYHAAMMEPWDGPAAIAFTDGRQIGAILDRNGLRPARYCLTSDDLLVLASEAGVVDFPEETIIKKWRMEPGKMLLVDTEEGKILDDAEIKSAITSAKPYKSWVKATRILLKNLPLPSQPLFKVKNLQAQQKVFGFTEEDVNLLIANMAEKGEEAIGSMGNDAALAVLSHQPKTLYDYFRQLFAQVTNPAIDPIREQMVMSLISFIGPKPNLLDINHVNPPLRLEVDQPILDVQQIEKVRHIDRLTQGKFKTFEINLCYPVAWGKEGVEAFLASLCAQAVDAIQSGHNILLLTDRYVSAEFIPIPALLATSAIHQHLVDKGLRTSTGLVVETGSAREVHHFATLAAYGAEAIHPYLALETVVDFAERSKKSTEIFVKNYIKSVGKGLLKVMSKMGISTYMSYTGAQIFEALGLSQKLVNQYFRGTSSRLGGLDIFDVAQEAFLFHQSAFSTHHLIDDVLPAGGEYAFRVNGQAHLWTPDSIAQLQHAVRKGTDNGLESYKNYSRLINEQEGRQVTLRSLFDIQSDQPPVSLSEVESTQEIVRRFATGAMSLGSISTEAHTTLALAMNRMGGKSNTGEGGEDPKRYLSEDRNSGFSQDTSLEQVLGKKVVEAHVAIKKGDSLRSKIKQVASGRFGVNAAYLMSADQIQIKISQGAKPGEGGQLPGEKVTSYIGELRYSVPGVGLISPPPHHDIYSIEDLAQLIHDLKNVNPQADISVKLVSELGIGTIAAGVAKSKADHIVIAGHDGGTGASPLSSIKHAGTPWEIGLAETQQTLLLNGLRNRVRLQVDGQLKTGRDVLIAALLGADEFGFATAPLVAQGCIMMRKCHLNTCPVGIATQDPVLRKKFAGQPEHVINFFFFLAQEVREMMAQLGVRRFDDMIGRADWLDKKKNIDHPKAKKLDFSAVFHRVDSSRAGFKTSFLYHTEQQHHGLSDVLDLRLISQSQEALERQKTVKLIAHINNTNRTVGAMLSGEVAKRYGSQGLPDRTISIECFGTAGQSFGAFLMAGIYLKLMGQANDYVGKGLSGGELVICPPIHSHINAADNMIVGNTVLYGAISGKAFFSGVAGERFAVRNSGAMVVVEGVGDHGCEYMTGGTVVVLGHVGRNFAAGLSGGVAYVLNTESSWLNGLSENLLIEPVKPADVQKKEVPVGRWHALGNVKTSTRQTDEHILKELINKHADLTGSVRAREILAHWDKYVGTFMKVTSLEYINALERLWSERQ